MSSSVGLNTCPSEIQLNVLSFLDPKELCQMSQVDRNFQLLCEEDVLWSRHAQDLLWLEPLPEGTRLSSWVKRHAKDVATVSSWEDLYPYFLKTWVDLPDYSELRLRVGSPSQRELLWMVILRKEISKFAFFNGPRQQFDRSLMVPFMAPERSDGVNHIGWDRTSSGGRSGLLFDRVFSYSYSLTIPGNTEVNEVSENVFGMIIWRSTKIAIDIMQQTYLHQDKIESRRFFVGLLKIIGVAILLFCVLKAEIPVK
ncbi:MAG TPA: F-box protein [Chlamydiales bacterium]|nr:F-box protein [Chlamydiales bacterium]